ncbi:MAG: peptidase S41, partial [Duncaniella sp.]|nr:peptidase S41 [Duncaniella sp.]
RYQHGELYSAASILQDKSLEYTTLHGRTVYGGGGITPDIFVPNDSTGVTSYYINVVNAGLIQKYTFAYSDTNRERLSKSADGRELLTLLPDDDTLLQDFVNYAQTNGVAPRWYYINISRNLLVNSLKAMIARNIHGVQGYYEVFNDSDPTVAAALDALDAGKTAFPIRQTSKASAK